MTKNHVKSQAFKRLFLHKPLCNRGRYFFLVLKKGDLQIWVYNNTKPCFLCHISAGFITLYLLAKQMLEYLPYPWHDLSKSYKSKEKLQIRLKVVFADENSICFQ